MARVLTSETTLTKQVDKLHRETSFLGKLWLYELVGGGALLVVGVIVGFVLQSWALAVLGGILAFLGASHILKRRENRDDIGRFEFGSQGEAEVARRMAKELPDTYFILNDISVTSGLKKAQNDHIVLGPNGIFVIETKAYAGRITGKASDDLLDQFKSAGGGEKRTSVKNPVTQNEYHCEVVAGKLRENGFVTDDVHSIVVFTHKWVRFEIAEAKVPIVRPAELCAAITEQSSKYSYDEELLKRMAELFAPGCTTAKEDRREA